MKKLFSFFELRKRERVCFSIRNERKFRRWRGKNRTVWFTYPDREGFLKKAGHCTLCLNFPGL